MTRAPRRVMSVFFPACLLALTLLPGGVLAQEAAPVADDRKVEAEGGGGETARAALPRLRHIDPSLANARLAAPARLRFLLEDDLPPFVFRTRGGALSGFSVAVAQAICRRAHVRCEYVVRPHARLRALLEQGAGDVVLAGLRPLPAHWRRLDFTRPYFRALGRFAVRRHARIRAATHDVFAGRRVAVVRDSVHAAYLRRHMATARLHVYADFAAAAQALRRGQVDALFGDWLQLAFWVRGRAAADCCRLLPQLFSARMFAWNHVSMAVAANRRALRDFLDHQLDRLQEDGELGLLARRFLPLQGALPRRAARATEGGGAGEGAAGKGARDE